MGTADGLARFPYIRESRRIKALRTVLEQDVSVHFQKGPKARPTSKTRLASDGTQSTFIVLDRKDVGISCRTRPFQIPLGALIPIRVPEPHSRRQEQLGQPTSPMAASVYIQSSGISARRQEHLQLFACITAPLRRMFIRIRSFGPISVVV